MARNSPNLDIVNKLVSYIKLKEPDPNFEQLAELEAANQTITTLLAVQGFCKQHGLDKWGVTDINANELEDFNLTKMITVIRAQNLGEVLCNRFSRYDKIMQQPWHEKELLTLLQSTKPDKPLHLKFPAVRVNCLTNFAFYKACGFLTKPYDNIELPLFNQDELSDEDDIKDFVRGNQTGLKMGRVDLDTPQVESFADYMAIYDQNFSNAYSYLLGSWDYFETLEETKPQTQRDIEARKTDPFFIVAASKDVQSKFGFFKDLKADIAEEKLQKLIYPEDPLTWIKKDLGPN